jgi:hypothetical protein
MILSLEAELSVRARFFVVLGVSGPAEKRTKSDGHNFHCEELPEEHMSWR